MRIRDCGTRAPNNGDVFDRDASLISFHGRSLALYRLKVLIGKTNRLICPADDCQSDRGGLEIAHLNARDVYNGKVSVLAEPRARERKHG